MSISDNSECDQRIRVSLTEDERTLLLSLLTIELNVEDLLRQAEVTSGTAEIWLAPDDLDALIDTVAFEANHSEDRKLQKSLYALIDRLDELFTAGG